MDVLRCVQVEDADRVTCNTTFADQVMTLTLGQILSIKCYSSFDATQQEERHAGKINVVALFS